MAGTAAYQPVWQDVEKGSSRAEDDYAHQFAERTVRLGFTRKVFGLLGIQLLITTFVAAPIVTVPAVKAFVLGNPWLTNLAMFTSLGLVLAFMFSERARQQHPLNLALLFTFTAAEGLLVGIISSQYQTQLVVLAFALTAALTVGLALYAMRTKTDFTASGGFLFAGLLGLITAGFLMYWMRTPLTQMLLAGGGAVLFCFYIVYDVQMIVGGSHQYKMSPDDYVMAAITVYLDIINLFIHLLRLLDSANRN